MWKCIKSFEPLTKRLKTENQEISVVFAKCLGLFQVISSTDISLMLYSERVLVHFLVMTQTQLLLLITFNSYIISVHLQTYNYMN